MGQIKRVYGSRCMKFRREQVTIAPGGTLMMTVTNRTTHRLLYKCKCTDNAKLSVFDCGDLLATGAQRQVRPCNAQCFHLL